MSIKCGTCGSEVATKPFEGLFVSNETGNKYNNLSEYKAGEENHTGYFVLCKKCSEGEPEKQIFTERKAALENMLITTTSVVDGKNILHYKGVVTAQVFMGANIFKDILASLRDLVGGRSKVVENELRKAKDFLMDELRAEAVNLGANAIIGIKIDFEDIGRASGNAFMLLGTGTAVCLNSSTSPASI